MDFLNDPTIATIVTLALTLIASIAGGFWISARGKVASLSKLITRISDGVADGTITPDEVKGIREALYELIGKDVGVPE